MKRALSWLGMSLLVACSGSNTDELTEGDAGGSMDGGSASEAPQDASRGDASRPGADASANGGVDAGMAMDAALPNDANAPVGIDAETLDASVLDAELDGDAGVMTVFAEGFETALPAGLDPGTGTLTGTQGFAELGPVGNKFGSTFLRSATANVVTLSLTSLPPHSSISLAFLFAAIDSLDGTGSFPAGDFFRISIDGVTVFRESFANATPDQIQSYVPPPGVELARHVDLGFQGPGSYYTDSAYDLGADPVFQDIPHSASTATIVFTLEGDGVQSLDDESWAIDNLRVTLGNTPRALDAGADSGL